ncbi:MAG: ribulose-phosphate 3-epimerase [Bryobacter sp.]|jgi:ribulose-phosphate 3-epimerase|nr:ribulose-phosphate 3-epimerase [Bryobacter sp.]
MVEILPSLLAADFAHLARDIAKVEAGGATMLHCDVMDGHFVPNLTIGPPLIASLRKVTQCQLDVHLMITNPDAHLAAFRHAGADCISVHQETCPHLDRTLNEIRRLGARPGVVLNPATPVATLEHALDLVDYVLLMSVNPGFGGQKFIPYTLEKVRQLARLRRDRGLNFAIEIDGGITLGNLREIVHAGCDWIVAGVTVFHSEDPAATVQKMKDAATAARGIPV